MKRIILLIILFISYTSNFSFAQFEFQDNFDSYITNQQLACQNPIDWTTWSNLPCSNEDPWLSNIFSFSWPNSVVINSYNDLIKLLGSYSTGGYHITVRAYVPNEKSGYISLFSKFNPDPTELAFECYFDVGGTGRLMNIPGEPVLFTYTNDQWHLVWIVVNFNTDEAQFWIDNNLIHIWEWTQNGTVSSQLAAENFYGPTSSSEMYLDEYFLFENNCLQCLPPSAPTNLIAQQVFNTEPLIQLNWQHSIFGVPRAYKIIRKNGFPSDPTEYEHLEYVPFPNLQYMDSSIVIDSTYTYGVIAMNMYGYSDTSNFATITVEPVPVELVSFTSEVYNNIVTLNWTTSTETNNSGFEILRSVKSDKSYWETIGFVEGHGTTTEPKFYSFTDQSLQPGNYQYKLKQIDFDGSFKYSEIVEVTLEASTEFSLSQNYPNPFNSSTTIAYGLPEATYVSLIVYDCLGNNVRTLVNEVQEAGAHYVVFESNNLSSGIYFMRIRASNWDETKRIIILK